MAGPPPTFQACQQLNPPSIAAPAPQQNSVAAMHMAISQMRSRQQQHFADLNQTTGFIQHRPPSQAAPPNLANPAAVQQAFNQAAIPNLASTVAGQRALNQAFLSSQNSNMDPPCFGGRHRHLAQDGPDFTGRLIKVFIGADTEPLLLHQEILTHLSRNMLNVPVGEEEESC